MLINLRNAMMSGKRLPYDAEVEYLESSGTQWIDTGYSFNSATDKVELVFELLTTTPNYKWIFGAYDSSKRFAIGSGDNANRRTFGYNASTSYYSSTYYTDGAHIFLADSTGASIDGHKFFGFADFSTTSHIILYSIPIDTSTFCSNSRIWSYKHYRNNVLVRDFIPVRKGTVGYLYDRVSGKLFGNAGTGDFVLGPDVVPVEYIESHGTEYIDTGFVPDTTDIKVEMKLIMLSAGQVFGCRPGSSFDGRLWSAYANSIANIRTDWTNVYKSSFAVSSTDPNLITFANNSDESSIVCGTTTRTGVSKTTYNYPMSLFGVNQAGSVSSKSSQKLWFFSAWKNNSLTLKQIPVRVGTEGAMMDVLTRRIYRNQGTGAFGYGNDLKYPIPA